jgi:hypothetical protein
LKFNQRVPPSPTPPTSANAIHHHLLRISQSNKLDFAREGRIINFQPNVESRTQPIRKIADFRIYTPTHRGHCFQKCELYVVLKKVFELVISQWNKLEMNPARSMIRTSRYGRPVNRGLSPLPILGFIYGTLFSKLSAICCTEKRARANNKSVEQIGNESCTCTQYNSDFAISGDR